MYSSRFRVVLASDVADKLDVKHLSLSFTYLVLGFDAPPLNSIYSNGLRTNKNREFMGQKLVCQLLM